MWFVLGEYRITGRRAAEISASVERGVATGALPPGHALPPLRELADRLGVNANTVAAAYRLLRERGVIETAGRRGSRVRARPVSTPRDQIRVEVPPGARDLSTGDPDPRLLPALAPAFAEAARAADARPVLYGQEPLDAGFARLARAAFLADGVPAGPLAATSGSSTPSSASSPPICGPVTPSRSRTRAGAVSSISSRRSGCGRCRSPSTTRVRCPGRSGGRWRKAPAPWC